MAKKKRKKPAKRKKRKKAKAKDKSHQFATDKQIAAALEDFRGMVTAAARSLGLTSRALYYRMEQNPELTAVRDEAREMNKDLAEVALFKAIERGDAWAVCFYLKTQAKDRGYIEKAEVEIGGTIEHSGLDNIREVADELQRNPDWIAFARQREQDRHAGLLCDERKRTDSEAGGKAKGS